MDYILIGGYAVIYHGYDRTTGDIDLWVRNTEDNYRKLQNAFRVFGMPTFDMTLENFLNPEKFDVFKFGRNPVRIDILTVCKGLIFEDTFAASSKVVIGKTEVNVIDIQNLLKAKRAAGRHKDLDDIDELTKKGK